MLTAKQKELLLLIHDKLTLDGVPPSFDEMKTALGLKSKSGIHRLITGLEERGFIRRLPHRARALEILKMPDGAAKTTPSKASKGGTASSALYNTVQALAETVALPLFGRIAAGTPIEALSDPSTQLDVPVSFLTSRKGVANPVDHYALEIAGDSMIEAGIMDGDRIIVRKTDTAENGAIVVALVDEHEATLKYIERRAGQIALVPANSRYETRLFPANRVKIQGRLVGLLRRY